MEPRSLYGFLMLSSILLIRSVDGFRRGMPSISIDQRALDEIITPIIIGAVLGHTHTKAKSRSKAKKQQEQKDNEASAQHQQPVFLPMPSWQQYPGSHLVQQPPYSPPGMPLMQPMQPMPPPPSIFHIHPHARHPQHPHPIPHHPHARHPHHPHPMPHHPFPHHQHAHPVPVAVIPHELVPMLYEQLFANIVQQAASTPHPVRRRPRDQRPAATVQTIEFIEKYPIHQLWFPPHPNGNFHPYRVTEREIKW